MSRHLIAMTLLALISWNSYTQDNRGPAMGGSGIILTPCLAESDHYPKEVSDAVKHQLSKVLTKYGLRGDARDPHFMLSVEFAEFTREVTATAPPMIVLEVSPTLSISDAVSGTVFASMAISSAKGVGKTEGNAYLMAVKSMKFDTPKVAAFLETGERRIIDYYNSGIESIIAKADAFARQGNYDSAILLLDSVPSVCEEAHAKAVDRLAYYTRLRMEQEEQLRMGQEEQRRMEQEEEY